MVEIQRLPGPEGLRKLLEAERPDAVGIDAPPRPGLGLLRDPDEVARLPVPPRAGTHLTRRVAEYELSRRGIGSHHTHFDETRLFSWMTAGFEVFDAARAASYPPYLGEGTGAGRAVEVFPYASYVALSGCLSPGRKLRLTWRRSVLEAAGIHGLGEGVTIDGLDAVCAGLTVVTMLRGGGSCVGDPREGVIVVPVSALEDRYRRCPPPNGPTPGATAARLCECGCGDPVRRRFLPGHDARLKSRLVRAAREGEEARRTLARLGWVPDVKGQEGNGR